MSLTTQILSLITRLGTEFKTTKTLIAGNTTGDLTGLSTSAKNNLVAAINELKTGYNTLNGAVNKNKGFFTTPTTLNANYPTATAGDYAIVGSTDTVWIWDTDGTPAWKDAGGAGAVTSVNGMTGAVTIGAVTTSVDGLMVAADKTKLNTIASGATANSTDASLLSRSNHTGTQVAETISDFAGAVRAAVLTGLSAATNAAVAATDTVLAAIGKLQAQITGHFGQGGTAHANAISDGASGFITGAEKAKLTTLAAHPTGDGAHHVPATGTANDKKVLKAGATAGSEAWDNVAFSELTGKPTTIGGYGITDAFTKTEIGDITTDLVASFNTAIA